MTEAELARFEAKVNRTDTCWLWTASVINTGYGQMRIGGRAGSPRLAHRLSYEHFVGPIPDGMELDHICRERRCVNPSHLEPVLHRENVRRGRAGAYLRERTHCPQGHEYTEENTYGREDGGRQCRRCAIDRASARYRELNGGLKGRAVVKGEANPAARLTRIQAEDIRRRCVKRGDQKRLAAEYGVSASLVSAIAHGRLWT